MEQALILTFLGMGIVGAVLGVNYLAILAVSLFGKEKRKKETAVAYTSPVSDDTDQESIIETAENTLSVADEGVSSVNQDKIEVVQELYSDINPKTALAIFAAIEQYESENGIA